VNCFNVEKQPYEEARDAIKENFAPGCMQLRDKRKKGRKEGRKEEKERKGKKERKTTNKQ
jgi:hypothetical protein